MGALDRARHVAPTGPRCGVAIRSGERHGALLDDALARAIASGRALSVVGVSQPIGGAGRFVILADAIMYQDAVNASLAEASELARNVAHRLPGTVTCHHLAVVGLRDPVLLRMLREDSFEEFTVIQRRIGRRDRRALYRAAATGGVRLVIAEP
jgi:hypothetical protein